MSDRQIITIVLFALVAIFTLIIYIAKKKSNDTVYRIMSKYRNSNSCEKTIANGVIENAYVFSGLYEKTYKLSLGNTQNADSIITQWYDKAAEAEGTPDYALLIMEKCRGSEKWKDTDFVSFAKEIMENLFEGGLVRNDSETAFWTVYGVKVE